MRVIISPRAEKELKKVHKIDQIAVIKKLRTLQSATSTIKKEKLSGYSDNFRVRFGHYRIVYRQRKDTLYIVLIGHRSDIYQLLKRIIGLHYSSSCGI